MSKNSSQYNHIAIPIGILFFSFLVSIPIVITQVVVTQEQLPQQVPPIQLTPTETIELQEESTIPAIITYDIYGRFIKIVEFFPFNYTAETIYTWYPNNYLHYKGDSHYYDGVIQKEESKLVLDGVTKVHLIKTFNEQGETLKTESEGLSIALPILRVIARLLGKEIDEEIVKSIQ